MYFNAHLNLSECIAVNFGMFVCQNVTGLMHMMSFTQTCAVFEKLFYHFQVVSDLLYVSSDRF